MKNLLTIIFLFISIISFSQIEMREPEVKRTVIGKYGTSWQVSLEQLPQTDTTEDEQYYLIYRNHDYTHIVDYEIVSFSEKETVNQLYEILKSVFTPENKKKKNFDFSISFTLGDDSVRINNYKLMGVYGAYVYVDGKGHFYITQSQVDKLFGI